MDTWSKELWVEGTFLERRFLKADLKQVHHHGEQRGDRYRSNLQAMQKSTDFHQIYKVETSQINNNLVMTAACGDKEGRLLFNNMESKSGTKKQHRLTAEVTKSTPCRTPTDFCHSRRGPSQGDTCCAGTSESHWTGRHQPRGSKDINRHMP